MAAPDTIHALVQRFDEQKSAYKLGKYNETELRRDFLDPYFEALGWDVSNRKGNAEKYREVIHEVSVEVEGQAKAADYAFRAANNPIFLVEAKKPSVNIESNPEPAFQIKRYGWSARLPVNLLTDFEGLAVYDCRSKPKLGDSPAIGRVKLYGYRDYVEKWGEISGIFSREAVYRGSFDQFAEGMKGKKGTADVDDSFLEEMERWREDLARNISIRNLSLTTRQINAAVQTTIDRIIFLRICEERGIEAEDGLRNATDGKDVYQDLMVLFRQADRKYNSGLFHFASEKHETSLADTLTPNIKIDDKVLKDILAHLYYPLSPYAFKYIPADILGSVYERFLGKVIRLTAGHQAKVEEKPEVRKAGGVYYTPTYIVDYIVKNTVGELLKDSSVPEQESKPIRVVDPACGSGSFLLGAYQYLLDWYLDWYRNHEPGKWVKGRNPAIFEGRDGWQLSMDAKKDILTRHLFGVDIDAQAVEVTKLSLLLKVVENPGQLSLLQERILPDLGKNIQCGNSLIGPDYYTSGQMNLFDEEEQYRVNAFDWQRAFAHVFVAGGFDAVIGNPPYIRIQALKEWAPTEVEFYKKKYQAASKGNYDIYVVFVEKGLSLLNPTGKLGFILPHKFFNSQYGEPLRGLIAAGKHLSKVVHFGDQQVFDGAKTYTCLMFLKKNKNNTFVYEKVIDLLAWQNGSNIENGEIDTSKVKTSEWNFTIGKDTSLFEKLEEIPNKLGDISNIFVGLQTSADTVFLFKDFIPYDTEKIIVKSKQLNTEIEMEPNLLKDVVRSGEIGRYWATPTAIVLFPYTRQNGKFKLITEQDLKSQHPKTWKYLSSNKKLLSEREHGKFLRTGWYQLYPKNLDTWEQPKVLIPYMVTRLSAYFDENNLYFVNVTTGGFGLTIKSGNLSLKYITGLLNSKLLNWYILKVSTTFHGGYFAANKQYIEQLPIHSFDLNNDKEAAQQERMVKLVERMLELHKRLASAGLPQEKEMIQRQIDTTDRQIDSLVYELYGLTEDEIAIVEGTP